MIVEVMMIVSALAIGYRVHRGRLCREHEPRALRLVDARQLTAGEFASNPRRIMSPKVRAGLESLLACAASAPERVAVCRHGDTLTLQEIRVAIADGDWCACCRKVEDPPWSRPVPLPVPGPGVRRRG